MQQSCAQGYLVQALVPTHDFIQILYMMLEVVIRETCLMGNRMALADLAHL